VVNEAFARVKIDQHLKDTELTPPTAAACASNIRSMTGARQITRHAAVRAARPMRWKPSA
jgi:hypothetical protein